VLQHAWKDQTIVPFMNTIGSSTGRITRARKRPQNLLAVDKKKWGDSVVKKQEIPTIYDDYNHYMGGVDIADQIRSYYSYNRHTFRTWKPLFQYYLQTTICNAWKLFEGVGRGKTKESGYLSFREGLMSQLMSQLMTYIQVEEVGDEVMIDIEDLSIQQCLEGDSDGPNLGPQWWEESLICLKKIWRYCTSCSAAKRYSDGPERRPLQKMNLNSLRGKGAILKKWKRPHTTAYVCRICKKHVCPNLICISEHNKINLY
jgi:hypothetical protein